MKVKYISFVIVYFISHFLIGQQRITITNSPKTVPQGKKWTLTLHQEIKIKVTKEALHEEDSCNILLFSKPGLIKGIVNGDYGRPSTVYGIVFEKLKEVENTNKTTYKMFPLAIVDDEFRLSEFIPQNVQQGKLDKVIFYQGERIYVGDCLESIQFLEENLDAHDQLLIKKGEH
jgi:hypothetical protein